MPSAPSGPTLPRMPRSAVSFAANGSSDGRIEFARGIAWRNKSSRPSSRRQQGGDRTRTTLQCSARNRVCDVPKHEPTSAEYQQVLNENDALRAAIVKLKDKLENCEMIRQEQASYIRSLWDDNRKAHAELRLRSQSEKL